MPQAVNKAVKVIAQLLVHLPLNYKYKIIFMERHLVEVIASQQKCCLEWAKPKMLKHFLSLLQTYEKTIKEVKEWMAKYENIEVLFVPYDEVLAAPVDWAKQISHFVGKELDIDAMGRVVDAGMKRENVNSLNNPPAN